MGSDSDSDHEDPRNIFIFEYDDPEWTQYSEALFRAAAEFPERRGSFEINDARRKRDKELENLARMCRNGDREACDKHKAFEKLIAQRKAVADDEEDLYMKRRTDADALRDGPEALTLRLDMDDSKPNPDALNQAKKAFYRSLLEQHETDRVTRVNLKKRKVPTSFFSK